MLGVEVELKTPKVPYRETIKKKADKSSPTRARAPRSPLTSEGALPRSFVV